MTQLNLFHVSAYFGDMNTEIFTNISSVKTSYRLYMREEEIESSPKLCSRTIDCLKFDIKTVQSFKIGTSLGDYQREN